MLRQVGIYTSTNIIGPKARKGFYFFLVKTMTSKGEATFHNIIKTEEPETENAVQLMAVIKGLEKLRWPCEVMIYTHSSYLAAALEKGWLKEWQKNGWKTKKGSPVANKELWERLYELMGQHLVNITLGDHEYTRWMKAEMERRKKDV
jgi:ribonuclease HI